jgi:hypothetical protein
MDHPHSRFLRIELTGELALGGYFLMAHWPDPETAPELESANGPLTLVFDTMGRCLDDLRQTLVSVHESNDVLAASVRAWWKELDRLGWKVGEATPNRPTINAPQTPRAG